MIVLCEFYKINQSKKCTFPTNVYRRKFLFLALKFESLKQIIFLSCVIGRIKRLVAFTYIYHTRKTKTITFGM